MKLDKIVKQLGEDTCSDLHSLSVAQLNARIALAEHAMVEAQEELLANPKYIELKENLKAITAGKRELNSRQRAIIAFCLHLLMGKGQYV